MSTSALIMLLVADITIAGITVYFFMKVLRTPPKPEPDSYSGNDDVKR
jgi:hypothetical protein